MEENEAVLFSAGHGFYHFAVSQDVFDRSLLYNLLLQPTIAIPDHYLLQGARVGAHLKRYQSRDSWLETGLRNGFVVPYLRQEGKSLSEQLERMTRDDRRGFIQGASDVAERLDRTKFVPEHWISADNSRDFGAAFSRYMTSDAPPILEYQVDPDDFLGFWNRSREWIGGELEAGLERSGKLLNSDGLLLSQLIQVSGERLLGHDCGRIESMGALLDQAKSRVGSSAERDLRMFYTIACELYNRSLADTILTSPGSPRWNYFVAAMDLWRDDALVATDDLTVGGVQSDEHVDLVLRLPRVDHLRTVSGDALLAIRRSPTCDRYFESLAHWRASPQDQSRQAELVESLRRYAVEIQKHVGKDIGVFGLRPQFISGATDLTRTIEKVSGVVQGFLSYATSTAAAATGAMAVSGPMPAVVPAGFATLFVLQTVAKYYSPSQPVELEVSARSGVRVYPDVTITRA